MLCGKVQLIIIADGEGKKKYSGKGLEKAKKFGRERRGGDLIVPIRTLPDSTLQTPNGLTGHHFPAALAAEHNKPGNLLPGHECR